MNYKKVELTEHQKMLKKVKIRKNYANSKSGATVIKATDGVQSKNAILDSNDETYLIIPDCSNKRPLSNL